MRTALRLSFALLALGLPGLAAATTVTVTGVDGMTSTIFQHNQSSFSGLGARMRLDTGVAGLELMPGMEYWRNSTTLQIYEIKSQRRDATLGVDARYRFSVKGWSPYLGAGFGIHFLSSQVSSPPLGVPETNHSIMKGGIAVLGGLNFPIAGAFESFLEAKYHLVSDYEQLKVSWGLAYNIP